MHRIYFRLLIFLFALVFSALPIISYASPTISGPVIETLGGGVERLKFKSNEEIHPHKLFMLGNPDRLVMDVAAVKPEKITMPSGYSGELVKAVRSGQFDPKTVRIVMELSGPVTVLKTAEGTTVAVDIAPVGSAQPKIDAKKPVVEEKKSAVASKSAQKPNETKTGASDAAKKKDVEQKAKKESAKDKTDTLKDDASDDEVEVASSVRVPLPAMPRVTNRTKALTDAEEGSSSRKAKRNKKTEDTKPVVMIDAGHGGQDPGALGLHKSEEKDVTLMYARALREALLRTGRYRVAMTRDGDHFVKLIDRVAMARFVKADIFISFHADSNPNPQAKGLSIYTLSENASDEESAALAERENKADVISGINLDTADADVASILIDLTQRETMGKSAMLADALVASLHPSIDRLPKTHRFAGFRVLKAPDIPSVLIEIGFLSNAADEKRLLSAPQRLVLVESVVKGIDAYSAKR